jgi:hypothetical protein
VQIDSDVSANELERRLRLAETHVITRVVDGFVSLDLRTVPPAQDEIVADAVLRAVTG